MTNKPVLIRQYYFAFFLAIFFVSCSSQTSNNEAPIESNTDNVDTRNLSIINSILNKGPLLFKKNCAVCHCAPRSSCDSYSSFRFENIFNDLPKDSLAFYINFVSNSKTSELKRNIDNTHQFDTILSSDDIETIVQSIWLECQMRN